MLLRKSAKGRVYYGCSNYPTCNFMTWDEPVPETCPHCGKTLFKRCLLYTSDHQAHPRPAYAQVR